MRECIICQKQFEPIKYANGKSRNLTCSDSCEKKLHSKKQVERRRKLNLGTQLGLSAGKIGKINEYIVAIDLLKRGFDVFTAFEDTHPYDILAVKDGRQLKIEVKTAVLLPSGLKHYQMKKIQEDKHDILALVTNLADIEYRPGL